MKKLGVYSRIFFTLIFTGVIFLFLLIALFIINNKQGKLMFNESETQFNTEVKSLITLKTNTLKQVAYDYTYWDEFVKKINIGDSVWYSNNITTILKTYRIDYVCVYDTSFRVVHEAYNEGFIPRRFISMDALAKIRETRFLNFFQVVSAGVIEISGASIHPDIDPTHTLTKPSGYLFLAKSWNQDFLHELTLLSGAKTKLSLPSDTIAKNDNYSISYVQKLHDWNDEIVARLIFIRSSPSFKLYKQMSVYMILIMLGSVLTTWFILHLAIRKWINKPLKLVKSILETEDPSQVNELQQCQGEFKLIGLLFREFISQQDALRLTKERAEESDNLKTSFLNNISHEIRTPFNGILGFLKLILEEDLTDDEKAEYGDIINISSSRLMNTINDIVEISQIQAGQIKVSTSEININKLIKELLDRYKADAENKGLKFIAENSLPDNSEYFNTDRNKLLIILNHLISNAIKFTKSGFVELRIQLIDKVDEILFSVIDTGVGIPKAKQKIIFDIFMQGDVSNTRSYEGSGLGLAIAKAYTEMLGGKIWVESDPEIESEWKGSVFYFTIPYFREQKEVKAFKKMEVEQKPENTINSKKSGLKILVVEDDESSAFLVEVAVRKFARELIEVNTGIEAVETCRNNPDMDLVFMDIKMADMDGLEATRQIRKFNKDVIIIAQTAYALTGDREKTIEAGCNDYISKPIVTNELKALIQKYF